MRENSLGLGRRSLGGEGSGDRGDEEGRDQIRSRVHPQARNRPHREHEDARQRASRDAHDRLGRFEDPVGPIQVLASDNLRQERLTPWAEERSADRENGGSEHDDGQVEAEKVEDQHKGSHRSATGEGREHHYRASAVSVHENTGEQRESDRREELREPHIDHGERRARLGEDIPDEDNVPKGGAEARDNARTPQRYESCIRLQGRPPVHEQPIAERETGIAVRKGSTQLRTSGGWGPFRIDNATEPCVRSPVRAFVRSRSGSRARAYARAHSPP